MNRQIAFSLLLLMSILMAPVWAHASECDDPVASEEVARCIGKDLRDADDKINASYKELMGKLSEKDRTTLRLAQRAWIKDRDSICKLDSKETNRERWYQALLQDYPKTVCVTRYTRQRTAELALMLNTLSTQSSDTNVRPGPKSPKPPAIGRNPEVVYDEWMVTKHATGKWYFEVAVDYAQVVRIQPCMLIIGVRNVETMNFTGTWDTIRTKDAVWGIVRHGIAVDLDNGKLYRSKNGVWRGGEPGSNLGHDLKLGRTYYEEMIVSADHIRPYLEQKAIVPNFGESPMTYALPAGYSPWRERAPNEQ